MKRKLNNYLLDFQHSPYFMHSGIFLMSVVQHMQTLKIQLRSLFFASHLRRPRVPARVQASQKPEHERMHSLSTSNMTGQEGRGCIGTHPCIARVKSDRQMFTSCARNDSFLDPRTQENKQSLPSRSLPTCL